MVLDNEFAASIQRLRKGYAADQEALAVEVIANVMDGTHNFLGQKHTARSLLAGEITRPKLAERSSWENWEKNGRLDMLARAQAEAERILRETPISLLDDTQNQELDTILEAALKQATHSE